MSVIIDFNDETNTLSDQDTALMKQVLQAACRHEDVAEDSELSVTVVDNETIHEMNNQYRDVDKPTDVISFALNDEEELPDDIEVPNLLGDIVISIDKAKEQAESYGHSVERELGFLAVHGCLHLLGYTHDTAEAEKDMFSRQETILSECGLER
ncbi:probable rRNA maturation factor [Alteribacillus persepolensis]|uniref:Endoribonuclease YbeY n=1 Tax=Alteribacillus persepolensis TaxID=568899 RepID=A0A1G8CQK0_9BACI|nr:rRNA maturation RNase YbeY [Alteribacillus persepolensis]SDH47797.1 probable rRNA maturation factor [Alteribacillus persepolensis]